MSKHEIVDAAPGDARLIFTLCRDGTQEIEREMVLRWRVAVLPRPRSEGGGMEVEFQALTCTGWVRATHCWVSDRGASQILIERGGRLYSTFGHETTLDEVRQFLREDLGESA